MAIQPKELHFVMFPLMAQGHMIPMVDTARLLAQQGLIITIVTTPVNASRFESIINRDKHSGLKLQLALLQFPSEESNLPNGYENLDLLPSLANAAHLFAASNFLLEPAQELLQTLSPRPSCIISDSLLPYTIHISRNFKIPRITFQGLGCFCNLINQILHVSRPQDRVNSESEYFVLPGLPDHIELTLAQTPQVTKLKLSDEIEKIADADRSSYGMLVNTFEELEGNYAVEFKKTRGGKVWCVGPVSLCNNDDTDKAQRGNKTSIDEHQCLKWLNSWEPSSVVYACLGSLCNLTPNQMMELGLGLESSNRPFIWVIRKGEKSHELKDWILESGFEERIKRRGLLIWGWAPQVLILSHRSIGGFLTHCGWNSTLEGISSGVPLITWPLFADQFVNERLIVNVLKIAVSVGVEVPNEWGEEDEIGVLVKKEDVKKAIDRLMGEGDEEGEERRRRVTELSRLAMRAVAEGGSSQLNIKQFIEDIMKQVSNVESK